MDLFWVFIYLVLFVVGYIASKARSPKYLDAISALQMNVETDPKKPTISIQIVMVLKKKTSFTALKKHINNKFCIHERLRQIPVYRKWKWPYWKSAYSFDVDDHLARIEKPITRAGLEDYVARSAMHPFKLDRPMWHATVFDNYISESGSGNDQITTAFVFRVHHCYGDGYHLLKVLLSGLTPIPPDAGRSHTLASNTSSDRVKKPNEVSKWSYLPGLPSALKKQVKRQKDIPNSFKAVNPMSSHSLSVSSKDSIHVVWHTLTTDITQLKPFARSHGYSLNDLLLAALTRALAAHAAAKADKATSVLAVIWAALSPLRALYKAIPSPIKWTNATLGLVYAQIPLQATLAESMHETVASMNKQMQALKQSPDIFMTNGLLKFVGCFPGIICKRIFNKVGDKPSLSVSNVVGPPYPVSFAGTEVSSMIFMVVPQQTVSTFVCILTMNNRITVGISTAPDLATKAEERTMLQVHMEKALQELATSRTVTGGETKSN